MKIEKKESSPCVISLTVKAEAEEVQATYKKVLNVFLREGTIPGFRKGKVPLAVIKQKFEKEIDQECKEQFVRDNHQQAIKDAALDVVNIQGVTEVTFSAATGCTFTMLVEVLPVFDLPKYKKLAIKKEDVAVTDDQVNASVEGYRRAFAKFEEAKDGDVIGEGDFVQIDYKGALDIKAKTPLIEVVPDQKVICENEGFWTQVEDGRFVPEILDALKGMKAGETKEDVKVKFAKEAAPEPIQGKKCVYTVTVKALRKRVLPDDAAFIEAAKVESLDALRTQTRERLEKEAAESALAKRKDQAIELLLKKADFDVPPSLVQRQTQSFLQDLAQRAQYSNLPADYFEKNRDQILADAENNAIRQVRLSYILLGIAKAENIEPTDDDVKAGLEKMAAGSNGKVTAEDLNKQLVENNQVELYKEQLRAEKALDLVLAEAK